MNQPPLPTRIASYPAAVRIVIGKLREAGYDAYMVGGCVRDALLGREPHDWDVTTSADPEEILRTFEAFRTIPTGLKHGTVSILIDRLTVEVTTFRTDGTYSDGRHPDRVTFTKNLADDLARRDFTVNAMAYNEEEGFVDLWGGRDDLAAKKIRAVGNPTVVIQLVSALGANRVREIKAGTDAELFRCFKVAVPALGTPVMRRKRVDLRNARHGGDQRGADRAS